MNKKWKQTHPIFNIISNHGDDVAAVRCAEEYDNWLNIQKKIVANYSSEDEQNLKKLHQVYYILIYFFIISYFCTFIRHEIIHKPNSKTWLHTPCCDRMHSRELELRRKSSLSRCKQCENNYHLQQIFKY